MPADESLPTDGPGTSSAPSRPARRPGASAVALDDNLAIYDDVGQLLILLNSSAAAVWERCDGSTTVDEMVETLAAAHPDDAAVVGEDVRQTLRKLASWGWWTMPWSTGSRGLDGPGCCRAAGALERMGRAHRPPGERRRPRRGGGGHRA